LPWGEGCLGYPSPYNWGLSFKVALDEIIKQRLFVVYIKKYAVVFQVLAADAWGP